MALMECPSCHKQVSDTRERCIHCGASLKVEQVPPQEVAREGVVSATATVTAPKPIQEPPKKEYQSLRTAEQEDLYDEFLMDNPKYKKRDIRAYSSNKIRKVAMVDFITYFLLKILIRITASSTNIANDKYWGIAAVIAVIAMFKALFMSLYCIFFNLTNKRKVLIVLKRFQAWLLKEKEIVYTVKFSASQGRQKKRFDGINLDLEPY